MYNAFVLKCSFCFFLFSLSLLYLSFEHCGDGILSCLAQDAGQLSCHAPLQLGLADCCDELCFKSKHVCRHNQHITTHAHTHRHTQRKVHVHACSTHALACTHLRTHPPPHTHTHTQSHIYTHIYAQTHSKKHTRMHAHTRMHTQQRTNYQ